MRSQLIEWSGIHASAATWPSGKLIRSEAILLQVDKLGDPLHHDRRRGDVHITGELALMNKPRVGVIGLGSMGGGVAKSLLRAGFPVRVCDVRPEVVQSLVDDGAVACAGPAE